MARRIESKALAFLLLFAFGKSFARNLVAFCCGVICSLEEIQGSNWKYEQVLRLSRDLDDPCDCFVLLFMDDGGI